MKNTERVFNGLMGSSVIAWGVLGLWQYEISIVRIAITILNLVVGTLFLLRSPELQSGSMQSVVRTLPSFVLSGLAFKLAPITSTWFLSASLLFAFGTTLAIAAFLFLWRNFAILPALRKLSTGGPYRLVRHPAYLGELLMITACCWMIGEWWAFLLFLGILISLIIRILEEEKLLQKAKGYETFQSRTPWRLLPFIW